jgi:hypothetical protein
VNSLILYVSVLLLPGFGSLWTKSNMDQDDKKPHTTDTHSRRVVIFDLGGVLTESPITAIRNFAVSKG